MTRDFRSIALDSLIPLSTTLESSIAASLGGPISKDGDASGTSSAFTVKTPSSGVSGKGSPVSTFIPARTFDFPRETWANPFAFCDQIHDGLLFQLGHWWKLGSC